MKTVTGGIVLLALTAGLAGCKVAPIAVGGHTICEADRNAREHLPPSSKLTINRLGANLMPTEVVLPDRSTAVLANVGGKNLVGAHSFTDQGGTVHFLRIRPDPNYRRENPDGACKSRNVHVIEICFKDPNAWRCADGNTHYGHAHSDPDF